MKQIWALSIWITLLLFAPLVLAQEEQALTDNAIWSPECDNVPCEPEYIYISDQECEPKVVVVPLGKQAQGDATTEDVREGKTFSSKHGVGMTGTLQVPEPDNINGATPDQVMQGKTFWGLRTDGTWGLQVGTARPELFTDTDGDGVPDVLDGCPNDPNKTEPGICGCGVSDVDTDSDGVADCNDPCPEIVDPDTDGDGTPDCMESCPLDPYKTEPGVCGCGVADTDSDGDSVLDCNDDCPLPGDDHLEGLGAGDVCYSSGVCVGIQFIWPDGTWYGTVNGCLDGAAGTGPVAGCDTSTPSCNGS